MASLDNDRARSLTAKIAEGAKEENSLTAKDAKNAKGTIFDFLAAFAVKLLFSFAD